MITGDGKPSTGHSVEEFGRVTILPRKGSLREIAAYNHKVQLASFKVADQSVNDVLIRNSTEMNIRDMCNPSGQRRRGLILAHVKCAVIL